MVISPAPFLGQCPYCGVGCGLELFPPKEASNSPSWSARGDRKHPSSLGQVCVKGATIGATLHQNRLTAPLWREQLDQPFTPISWDQAFELLVAQIQKILATKGPSGLAVYGSGQFLTEDYYLAQKLFKGYLGCNHFDANSRLCMSSAVAGYSRSLGSDGPPCCYDDLDVANLVLLIGTNTAECHPVLWQRLMKRKRRNPNDLRIIVVDPRCTATASDADLHLAIKPGTDLVLLHGIAQLLVSNNIIDHGFVAAATHGYAELTDQLFAYTPQRVSDICGIDQSQLYELLEYWQASDAVLSAWSMGVNQSVEGSATVSAIINLHLISGQICKPGAGPFSLTGQPNAMGGREAGGLSQLLPGYRTVTDPLHRTELEHHWNLPEGSIAPEAGRDVWQQVEAMERGELGLWWVAATNPLVSLPSLDRVRAAVQNCPFVVLSEAYAGTETADVAHLLLPAAQWSEKQGVMTNSERRVTLCQAFRDPPGLARADWAIFAELGRRLGFFSAFDYSQSSDVYAEFVAITTGRVCDMAGLSHSLLADHGPQQWPFPLHTVPGGGAARLYCDKRFPTKSGRARLLWDPPFGLAEPPCDAYPLILTVGRYLGHWHTMTRTALVPKLMQQHPEALLEVNPLDAERVGLNEGDWAEIRSRRGMVCARVQISKKIRPGTVFLPMHWGASQQNHCEANRLMHELGCPYSKQPELKAAAVSISRQV